MKIWSFFKLTPFLFAIIILSATPTLAALSTSSINAQVLPALEAEGVSADLINKISTHSELIAFLAEHDMRAGHNIGEFAFNLLSTIPLDQRQSVAPNLTSQLYLDFNSAPIQEIFAHATFQNGESQLDTSNSRPDFWTAISETRGRLNGSVLRFYHKDVAQFVYRLKDLVFYFDKPDVKGISELEPGPDDFFVTVYRGFPYRKGIEADIETFKSQGVLSPIALASKNSGKTGQEAIEVSDETIKKRGVQSTIMEHVIGNWKVSSPYIATSLDKNIARNYAGKNGYVLEIKVPMNRVFFLNDLIYWQETPWEKTGDPSSKLQEVVIPSYITPEEIVAVEQVKEVPFGAHRIALSWLKQYYKAWEISRENRARADFREICVGLLGL